MGSEAARAASGEGMLLHNAAFVLYAFPIKVVTNNNRRRKTSRIGAMNEGRLTLNFDDMNETDVREIIVRPLLHRLGYQHGSEANIRTETTLRYDKAFLGRKSPKKDPPLTGRADYVCEVISYGRWVVEVKGPKEDLDIDAVQQAHTYAAHPEISATYILLTNGKKFALYRTGALDNPLLSWDYENLEENLLSLFNVVSPDAIKKMSKILSVDPSKPLGKGISSKADIIGGVISYEDHKTNTPLFPDDAINGLKLPVTGGQIRRMDDGRIHAYIEIGKAGALFRDFNELVGAADDYDFFSADEYISDDSERPTIFQNLYESVTPAGKMTTVPGLGAIPMPFGFILKAYTEAVGFISDGKFIGTMRLDYELTITGLTPITRQAVESIYGKFPDHSTFSGMGSFEVKVSN
jgi:hypothetical protein